MEEDRNDFLGLSEFISEICVQTEKKIVLMIDEVDQVGNTEIFTGFLGGGGAAR